MQKKILELKTLYNDIIELLILEDFKSIISKIKEIKQIIENIEPNSPSGEIKTQDKKEYFELEAKVTLLEERVCKLEKLKNPSMQIINKGLKSNSEIWN